MEIPEQIIAYHERTKHRLERYAAGPDTLDWDAQPNPYREFSGSSRILLPLVADALAASFDALHKSGAIAPQPFTHYNVAALLEISLAISAWKQYGHDRWAVRCNPSSGNLHPTEAYVISQKIEGLEDGLYHYVSRDHALELRCHHGVSDAPRLLVGISSITWREAWKYGERAFRYCQLDAGHAIGSLRYAAAALGWHLRIRNDCSHQQLEHWMGLNREADFGNAEREEAELLIEITADGAALPFEPMQTDWQGHANLLDAHHMYRWPAIDEAAKASRKSRVKSESHREDAPMPAHAFNERGINAAALIRQRRSAQRFDAASKQDAESFYRMLDALLPRACAPWDAWQNTRVHPVLFVHRVDGLAPGLYALPRSKNALAQMQSAMQNEFLWSKPEGCPNELPLYLLARSPLAKAAKTINCHQAIASDGTVALAMLAQFDAPLKESPSHYRELFWEAGLLGQVLYLEAEAANLRGTGIGCFFDDSMHELLGLKDRTFQSVYHFTVGHPLTDSRIISLPPYP